MRKKIFFGLLVAVLAIFLLGLFVYQRSQVLGTKAVVPFTSLDPTFTLLAHLEKSGLIIDNPPILVGKTLSASISGVKVLFSVDQDLDTQVRALQLVLPGLRIDAKKISEVDLRFNKVIVR